MRLPRYHSRRYLHNRCGRGYRCQRGHLRHLLPPALASASKFGHAVFAVRTARSCSWGQSPNMESARANRTKYRASRCRNRAILALRMKLKLRITNTARTRSRQFGPRGGATAHHTKEKHSELGGKIVRARKYFCTVIWGLFWPFLKICSRSGFAQFKNQPGYHYTIVIEYIFSRVFQ